METSFQDIKQKDVVNVRDGKKLGRTTDIVFTFPDGRVTGIIVPGCKGFSFSKTELFIDLRNIVKIGEDTVLVEIAPTPKPVKNGREKRGISEPPPAPPSFPASSPNAHSAPRRSYEDYE